MKTYACSIRCPVVFHYTLHFGAPPPSSQLSLHRTLRCILHCTNPTNLLPGDPHQSFSWLFALPTAFPRLHSPLLNFSRYRRCPLLALQTPPAFSFFQSRCCSVLSQSPFLWTCERTVLWKVEVAGSGGKGMRWGTLRFLLWAMRPTDRRRQLFPLLLQCRCFLCTSALLRGRKRAKEANARRQPLKGVSNEHQGRLQVWRTRRGFAMQLRNRLRHTCTEARCPLSPPPPPHRRHRPPPSAGPLSWQSSSAGRRPRRGWCGCRRTTRRWPAATGACRSSWRGCGERPTCGSTRTAAPEPRRRCVRARPPRASPGCRRRCSGPLPTAPP